MKKLEEETRSWFLDYIEIEKIKLNRVVPWNIMQ